jgi:hypothetical protein
MTPAEAREKLAAVLDETFTAEQCRIAAAFGEPPFKTPRGGWNMSRVCADAILSAFPQLAPSADVLAGAQLVVDAWMNGEEDYPELRDRIAAFASACAAEERSAVEQIIKRRMKDLDESMAHYGKPGGSYEMVERADHAKHAYADILSAIRARTP